MSFEERSAWIMGILAIATYSVYAAVVLGRTADAPVVTEVSYIQPMLWAIGGSIVISILLHIVFGMVYSKDAGKRDQRDKEIDRIGTHIGQSFLIIGSLGALVLAMFESPHFWIANALYLGFTLSAILGSIAKIVAYRRGFQSW